MAPSRLGDIIDDYCTRCRLLTNHSVVAMVGEEVRKVRCRTCNHEHDYRHGKGGEKKPQKLSAYEQVLASVLSGKNTAPSPRPPETPKVRRTPSRGALRPGAGRTRPRSPR
jgi:hypothetical protein